MNMYSLYRAWFGDENYPHLETLSPPDTVVRVGNEGEHQFVAHRGILAAHSGYLKALLSTNENTESSVISSDSQRITSISVSSVGGEAFAPLLNYMYTGHLEVTLDNIYSVLLATHLLHMPGALEQCRAALLRLRGPPPPPVPPPPPPQPPPPPPLSLSSSPSRSGTTLYRPVPNRLVGPPLCWPQSSLYSSASVAFPHLTNLQLSSGIPTLPNSQIVQETIATTSYSFRVNSLATSSMCYTSGKSQKNYATATKSTKSKSREDKEELSSRINNCDLEETKKEQEHQSTISRDISNSSGSSERNSIVNIELISHHKSSGRSSRASNENNSIINSNGVVLDVACCDGPVTFHRVLNENYTTPMNVESSIQSRPKPTPLCASSSKDEQVTEENDENGRPDRSENEDSNGNSNGSGGNYTCEYCRHTFKSHYCYKKHTKRHLLPNSADINVIGRTEEHRREVRLLDLNVQYYPCKICGSKFPSYYFVHKHKKLCHSSADERNTEEDNNQSVEAIASSSKT